MEVEGTIVSDLGLTEGMSKAGRAWKKHEWVFETLGMYPRKVKFHVFGDKADQLNFQMGQTYTFSFDIESREFNGRWYTDISVYAAREGSAPAAPAGPQFPEHPAAPTQQFGQPAPSQPAAAAPAAPQGPFDNAPGNTDDLPF